ncbi:MAG TPA: hypothetical protein VGN07_04595 [Steroidobacteraceae bacterium]
MQTGTARQLVCIAAASAALACTILQFDARAADNAEPSLSGPGLQQWRRIAMDRAVATASTIADPYRRAEAFAGVAKAQIASDDMHGAEAAIRAALAAADLVTQPAFRGWVFHDIVVVQIAADDLLGARQTADRIHADRPHGAALVIIAEVQLRSGELAAAQATAAKIRDRGSRGTALRQIVAIQAAADALPAGLETLRAIDDDFYLAYALGDVAAAEVRRGDIKAAEALVGRARRNQRPLILGRIAVARADVGDIRGALDTLARIEDPLQRAVTLSRVASARIAVGQVADGQRLLVSALNSVDPVRNLPYRKAVTLSQLARVQISSGDRSGALSTLGRALVVGNSLQPGEQRDDALDLIARSQARAGNAEAAMTTASGVTDRIARALLIRDVVSVRTEQGTVAAGVANFDDPLMRTAALFGMLGAQLTKPNLAVAAPTIDAAHAAVSSIGEMELKPAALATLASLRVASGNAAGDSIFQEAIAAAEAVGNDEQRAIAYTRIVDALNDRMLFLGQPVRGERTLPL